MANKTIYPYGANGQLPSSIGIVNDPFTGGADKALSAEAGKFFHEEVFGETEPIDLSLLTSLSGLINADNKWIVGSGGTCVLLPVQPGERYIIKGNEQYDAQFAFLAQDAMGANNSTPEWASGYSARIILQPADYAVVIAPSDAETLYLREQSSVGAVMLPFVYKNYPSGLSEDIEEMAAKIDGNPYELSSLPVTTGIITADKLWANSGGTCVMLPITGGQKYSIINDNDAVTNIAVLAQSTFGPNGSTPQWATGYDGRIIIPGHGYIKVSAPENAVALYVRRTQSNGTYCMPTVYNSEEVGLDNWIERNEESLLVGTFNSSYNEDDTTVKREEFCSLFQGKQNVESFLFFSDPHLTPESRYETIDEFVRDKYISKLQKFYNALPMDNCICGGDWLNFKHTDAEACGWLGYCDAYMRKLFKNYRPLLGNHDTNPYITTTSRTDWLKALSYDTVRSLIFRENGETYYSFDGTKLKFYMMNSGMSYTKSMTDSTYAQFIGPRWEQIDWLGNKLLTDDADNSIIAMHIYSNAANEDEWFSTETGYSANGIHQFGFNCKKLAIAYNNRESITLNGETYDFSNCNGRVLFLLCGHTHFDYVDTSGEIPVICTTNLEGGCFVNGVYDTLCVPTFDCCLADLDGFAFYMTRIGVGVSRIINYVPVEVAVSGTASLATKLNGSVAWSSRDTAIATVADGVVSGVTTGVVGIVASDQDGNEEYWIINVE